MAPTEKDEKGLPTFSRFTLTAMLEAEKTTGVPGMAMLKQAGLLPQPPAGAKILDNACGSGVIAKRLFENVAEPGNDDFRLVCGDKDQAMIDMTTDAIQQRAWPNVSARLVDAQATGYPDGEFDHVVMNFGPQLMADAVGMLTETRRVTRSGGAVGFTTWKETGWLPSVQATFPDFNPPGLLKTYPWKEPESIKDILTGLGFEDVRVEELAFDTELTEVDAFLELMGLLMPGLLNGANMEKYRKFMTDEVAKAPVSMSWQALIVSAKKP